jgi:hypothetical protein
MRYVGKQFTITEPVVIGAYILVVGTRFTVVGKAGNKYICELHNPIRRQVVVGRNIFNFAERDFAERLRGDA